MTERSSWVTALDVAEGFFRSPRFSAALALAIIGTEVASLLVRQLIGWPGLIGALSMLVVLATLSLVARRHDIEWHGLLPISLLVFVGWAAISVFWSQYQWATLGSVVYLASVTMLGIYVALVRDTIQIARAFGDVLRVMLALSIALEIFSGILIDTPLPFLFVGGHIAELGPIQGIFGTRNQLGVVALIGLITFVTELRTRSVPRWTGIASVTLAGGTLLLARSPVAFGTLVVVVFAAAALLVLRRLSEQRKRIGQIGLLVVSIAAAATAWGLRTQLIAAFSASAELKLRLELWAQMRALIPLHELEGWGWVGHWRKDVLPFTSFLNFSDRAPTSGLNAYLDVWLQLGLIGLLAFLGLLALTFVRSWLLASRQRSFVYAWPALVLVALLITSLAESAILVEFGWLTFVVCSVKAARELSWRRAFAVATPQHPTR